MNELKHKKKFLIAANIVVAVLIGYFVFLPSQPKRNISSIESDLELNLQWQKTDQGLIFKVSDNDGQLCNKWSSMDIIFRAEGLAYSGEVDRVVQTATCEEESFQQTWVPNLTQVESSNIQKIGYFGEEPPMWVLEQIVLEGSSGNQVLSAEDIQNRYGTIPTLVPNEL